MGHLHHEGFSPYTGEFPDLPFLLVVTAKSPDAGARTGKTEVDGSDPPFLLPGAGAGALRNSHLHNTPWGGAPVPNIPGGKARTMGMAHKWHADALERDSMKWRHSVLVLADTATVIWHTRYDPRAGLGTHRAPIVAISGNISQDFQDIGANFHTYFTSLLL